MELSGPRIPASNSSIVPTKSGALPEPLPAGKEGGGIGWAVVLLAVAVLELATQIYFPFPGVSSCNGHTISAYLFSPTQVNSAVLGRHVN